MKNQIIYALLATVMCFVSCSEDDKLSVITQESVTRGAILRTISIDPADFLFDDLDSPWTIIMEEQDLEDGNLLSNVDVLVGFVDQTTANGTTTATESPLATIPATDFTSGPNGLPRITYSITYGEALNALGLDFDPNVVDGGDQINVRFVINLTDGRSFDSSDLTGDISGGSFFSSPLSYRVSIVCPPKSSVDPGTWSIEMQDSFGDGWNGASLDVIIDGTAQNFGFDTGAAASFTFDLPADAEVLSIMYRSGSFDGENTFQVFSDSGAEVLNLGPSPTADVELLNYCADF